MAENKPFLPGKPVAEFLADEKEQLHRQEQQPTQRPKVDDKPIVDEGKKAEPAKAEPIKVEPKKFEWLDEANKFYKTEFKSPEELGARFERSKKADEYEPKITEYESKEKTYKKQIEDLQSSLNPLNYFSSQEAYVAEQLRRQHPDKSPYVLQQVVTSDIKGMADLDVLIKNQLLENPDLIGGEKGAEEYILDKYGIDPATPKEEWSVTVQNKIKIEANAIRKSWNELKSKVEVPKIQTPEEKEQALIAAKEEKKKSYAPLRDTFSKFDKITEEIEPGIVLEFNVSDEDRKLLPDMFDAYTVEAGNEPTAEVLKDLEELKRALTISRNFKQILKVFKGDMETRWKEEQDRLLGNNNPSNTKSATELEGANAKEKFSNEHGLGKLMTGKK